MGHKGNDIDRKKRYYSIVSRIIFVQMRHIGKSCSISTFIYFMLLKEDINIKWKEVKISNFKQLDN